MKKYPECESGHKKLPCQNAMDSSAVESVNKWLQVESVTEQKLMKCR